MSNKLPKGMTIESAKSKIVRKMSGLAWQNFVFRAFNLCDNKEVVSEIKSLAKGLEFLIKLEKNTEGS